MKKRLGSVMLTVLFVIFLLPSGARQASAETVIAPQTLVNPMVSAGSYHMVALKENGEVWAWGHNYSGELGDGTVTDRHTPVKVNITGVKQISAGNSYTVALKENGEVWAWGDNSCGKLGDGTTTTRKLPIKVNITGVKQISTGFNYTVALKENGEVWAWGRNYYGELGDGTAIDRYTPIKVNIESVKQVAAGDHHTVVLKENGEVWAWGYNYQGQVGDGTRMDRYTPVKANITGVKQITAGDRFTVALKENGEMWAWGNNDFGGLGDGTTTDRYIPVKVNITGVKQISARASQRTVALKENGEVWAWGSNCLGQLGDGTITDRYTPVKVNITGVKQISTGYICTVALKENGEVWTWGENTWGKLGDGTTTDRLVPVKIGINLGTGMKNVDNYIIEQVSKYTSDDMLFMADKILTSEYSDDVKFQVLNEIYQNYGLTDVSEGVQYLSETSAHRMNYRFLTTDDIYGAYNFGKMLANDTAARSALYTQGLIFNFEAFEYLDIVTGKEEETPGTKKYKQMLKDFMEQNDKEVDALINAKKTGNFLQKMVTISDIETSDSMEELMDEIMNCTSKERLESLQKQFAGYLLAVLGEDKRLYFKSENFQKALGSATDIISCVADTVNGLVTLFNMEEQMALYEQYSYFLKSIYTNVKVSGEMRIAAKQLYDEIENGYYKQIQSMLITCYNTATEALDIDGLEKMIDNATGGALSLIKLATFVSNIIIDTGDFTRQAAYTQGYAELSTLFRLKLEEDAANFKVNRTAENAWKFFDDYNLLWSLRYKGEEQFLRMNSIKAFVFGNIKSYNYAAKKELVDDTLSRLNNCKFEFTEYDIPKARQYLSKSIMNCPVNVYVYTQEGELVAELLDGVESDVTNTYGRFAVVYRPYTGEFAKIICQNTDEKLIIKAEAVSDGLVNFETATVNETKTYTFDNVNIKKGNIIETENASTYTIFNDEKDEVGTQYTLNENDRNIYVPVENITINNKANIALNLGEEYVLDTTVFPGNATNKMVTWISGDEQILKVKAGVVTALREGTTSVFAYAADGNGIVDSMEISVVPANIMLTKEKVSVNSAMGQFLVAGYKNGAMEKMEFVDGYEKELTGYDDCEYIKAFLFKSMNTLIPLCDSKTEYINPKQ